MVTPARPRVPVLVGPTASGKSAVAVELALLLDAEIVSADARQVYRGLDIGTAKPSPDDLARIPHHCVGIISADRQFSAGEFSILARNSVLDITTRGRQPVIVGGSGLYIRALVDGLFKGPGADPELRRRLEAEVAGGKLPLLVEELREADPGLAARIDRHNPRRVVRALEVYRATGKPLSEHQRGSKSDVPFDAAFYGLLWERQELYRRIEERCESMVGRGLIEEAGSLLQTGFSPDLPALSSLGYAEAFACLRGDISREEMLRVFKQNSRRYAKRQMTWFRADRRIHWIAMRRGRTEAEVAGEIRDLFLARPHA